MMVMMTVVVIIIGHIWVALLEHSYFLDDKIKFCNS